MLDKIKQFAPSSWAIDNRMSVYILTVFLAFAGVLRYQSIPKESFPEILFPQILVNTVYPGTSPANMESLVTKEIEKEVKAITGVKKVTSTSIQNFSSVIVEFTTDQNVEKAKQRVKDAVDKAKLPNDLPNKPSVLEIDISQTPIMNIHLYGDFDLARLKKLAETTKDRIEGMKEIRRVDIIGALDREVQINVDIYKMESNVITFTDIERAIGSENVNISGGDIELNKVRRTLSVEGQYIDAAKMGNLFIKGGNGAVLKLSDIAEVKDASAERASYARLEGKNVISLNVVKKSGQNLIESSDKIHALMQDLQRDLYPKGLNVKITGDQSDQTRVTLHDLINTIIIGFILVTLILMFFMGVTNAIFVAMSVPLSMFMAFLIEPALFEQVLQRNFSMNVVVLFAFLLALGIVVDDAIVVIENTHRIFQNGKVPIKTAAKLAAGEVFVPVLSGTLTTLAPFFPLMFWEGVTGGFIFFLPVTMIITLFASLVVAYIINPVFAVDFMKPHLEGGHHRKIDRGFAFTTIALVAAAAIAYVVGGDNGHGFGNLFALMLILYLLNKFILTDVIEAFQQKGWPAVQRGYAGMMTFLLKGSRPIFLLIGTVFLLFFSFYLVGKYPPNVVFFPQAEPNFAFTYITLPVGTDVAYTDKVTQEVERRIVKVLGEKNPMVTSIISNVAVGATDPRSNDFSVNSHKAKISVAFVKFEDRHGEHTLPYLQKIRDAVKGIPGVETIVEQEQGGPPTGKPISIEISGEKFEELSKVAADVKRFLDAKQIAGVEELKSDLVLNKPEITVDINRERANREGISSAQIGLELRTALFGKEISKFKDGNDAFPVQLRLKEDQRNNISTLMNQKITFRDFNMGGQLRSIPLSAVADFRYSNAVGGIKRKNQKRLVTIGSNVLGGYNPNNVVAEVEAALKEFKVPETVSIRFGGEQEEQKAAGAFLGWAMSMSIALIVLILVIQFNSISKPIIILSEIIFSIIGVLLGFVIFRMDISIFMTGIGVVALAGIVVRNGILLVEFTEILLRQGMELRAAIVEAGKTRMTPVLLTASATILGLVPLAVGLNIDFVTMFTHLQPNLHFGGDNVAFWGPLSWTMIFGLAFATFLTLILVPAMMLLAEQLKMRLFKKYNPSEIRKDGGLEIPADMMSDAEAH
jgi:multidrug efflux pump